SETEADRDQLEERKRKLAASEREARALRARVEQLQASGGGASQQALQEIERMKSALAASEQRVTAQQSELAGLERSSAEQESQLNSRLAASQQQEEQLRKQLASQGLSADLTRSQVAAAEARARSMSDQVTSLTKELASAKQALQADRRRLEQQASTPN